MDDIILETPVPMEEIEENFKDFDLFFSLKQGLEEAVSYQQGKKVPGIVVHERTLPDVDTAKAR